MKTVVKFGDLLNASEMLQIGRDSVNRLTEFWGRTPELLPKIAYRRICPRGQESLCIRFVKEKTFERRWPELLSPEQPFYEMCIILEHPEKEDRIILAVKSGDLSQLVIKYFNPSGKINGSSSRYSTVVIEELEGVARREPRLF